MRPIRSGPFLAGLLTACVAALPTVAEARPDTRTFTCDQVRSIVQNERAITMNTGAHSYERFVSDRSQCMYMEIIEPVRVPTQETAQCFAGYRCISVTIRRQFE
ncbi:hypothetical protein [Breoghania sp.]|uniref:hypothetical protein n=1 Tax=Breoghania sp. TaxID=2065378 RepID=UPI0029CA9508|nr:hypothetical protein [Breoghania sp.]